MSNWDKENLYPVNVIPATDESAERYSDEWATCGDYFYEFTPEHLAALQQGQALVLEIGTEYLAFVRLRPHD